MIFKTFQSDLDGISNRIRFSKRSFAEWGKQVSNSFKESEGVINSFKNALKTAFTVPVEKNNSWIKNKLGKIVDKDNINSYIPELTSQKASDLAQRIREQSIAVADATDGWDDYFTELKNNKQGHIVDLIKNTDDLSKLTGEDLVKANQQARASALAHNEAIKAQTLSAKAGKVALQALAVAGNMLTMWGITEVITLFHDLVTASDRLKESAEELGSTLSSTRSDFEDYQKRINELQDVIKSDSSSYQETYDARQQLLGIQDELIEKYGDEAETIRLVTEAINGNNDALNELSQNKAKEILKDFNEGTGKKWTARFADSIANFFSGSKNNVDRMVNQMEDTKIDFRIEPVYDQNLNKVYADFQSKVKEIFNVQVNQTDIGNTITVSGDLDEIYNKLQNIKSLAKDMGIENSSFFTDLDKQISKAKDSLDSYSEAYNQYILSTKIFENDDYVNAFNNIREEYKKYQEAFASGDEESIEKAKQSFAEIVHGATEEITDKSVVDFFEQMYPNLQTAVSGWEFELRFKAAIEDDKDNFENDVKDYVSKFKTSDDIRNYNEKIATDEQITAYYALLALSDEYETDLDNLIAKLEQLGLIAPQVDADVRNSIRSISDDNGISDRNEYNQLIAYTADFTEEKKKLWLESTRGAKNATEAIKMYKTTLAKAQQTAHKSGISPLSISQTINQLNTRLKPAFDSLQSAYQDIFTDDGFALNTIDILSTCDAIKSKLDEMSDPEGLNLDADYSAFEDFVRVLNNTESTEQDVENAFDSLATSITQAALSSAEDFETMKASLEDLGVVNNEMVAFQTLINNTTALEEKVNQAGLTMDDFIVQTEDGSITATDAATAFVEEMVGAENCSQALALLQLQQMLYNENSLNSTDDINACLTLAKAAGVAVESLSWLANISAQYDAAVAAGDTVAQKNLAATMENIKAKINDEIANFQPHTVDFSGISKDTKSAGSKAGKDYKDALKEELSDLDSVISGITGKIDDQISVINEQKSVALESIDAQKEALEEAKDAAVEALEAKRDAQLAIIEGQKKALEKKIKAKQDEIDAINEAAEARKREIDLQKAQYELERMQNQRTKLVYSEKGMHYEADTNGIRNAREKVDEARRQIEIADLEKEKELLEDQLDLLDERTDTINRFYDEQIKQTEKFYDTQIKALENQQKETEKYYESLSNDLEQRKEKFQELTEILEKVELSAKLNQLGIDEEALLNGSEEEFNKLKDTYMNIVFQLNQGNDEVLNRLRELSGYEGTAPAILEDSNTKLDTMNTELGTASEKVGNVNSTLVETASTTGEVATNIGMVVDWLNQMPECGKVSGLASEFETLATKIREVAKALGIGEGEAVSTLFQAMSNLNTVTLGGETEGIIGKFTLLKQAILDVIETIGSSEAQTVENLMYAIVQLNSMKLDESIVKQFTNLKTAVDSVVSTIGGGGSESSDGSGSGGSTSDSSGKGKASGTGGSAGGLVGAIKNIKSITDEALGKASGGGEDGDGGGSKGGGTGAISKFEQLKTAVDNVSDSIGSEGIEDTKGEKSDTLIGSIDDLGTSVTDTLGESGGEGIIGKFEEFRDVIKEAADHVKSIYKGLTDIDEENVECTITINVKMNGSIPQFASGTALGQMQIESAKYNAKYGKALAGGTIGLPKAEKNALVSEYGQTEMTVLPDGKTIITDEPTMMDLQKDTVIYNEELTKKIMDNKIDASGNAHADGTADSIWTTLADGTKVHPLQPGDRMYDLQKAFEPFVEKILSGEEKLVTNAMFEGQSQFEKWTNQITNNSAINNIVNNNKNVQQPITIQLGDINLTGIQDVNGLAHAIKTRLPNAMLQELHRR